MARVDRAYAGGHWRTGHFGIVIPDELRALPQWVSWRYETRGEKRTKVPLNPATGRRASSTDPATWGTYEAAAQAEGEGPGFVFSASDPYCGVDMDGCVSRNGAVHPAARRIVDALGGWVEFSPSGRGLHIIVRASLLRGRHTLKTEWGDEFAAYDRGRFFTMAGDGRGQIREAQDELAGLIAYYFPEDERGAVKAPVRPPAAVSDDDVAVVDRILADARMAALWSGDCSAHGGDHSQADLALANHLAFLTGNDPARMDSLFRRSGLMREKWDQPRGESTYGAMTIDRALRQ